MRRIAIAIATLCLLLCLPSLVLAASASSSSDGAPDPSAGTGLDGNGNWSYAMAFDAAEGGPVLRAGHLRVAFRGENYAGSCSGSVTLQAGQMGRSQSGSLRIEANGTNATITFRGKSFSLLEGGKTLKVGDKTYALADTTDTTVRFAADGTAAVTEKKTADAGK